MTELLAFKKAEGYSGGGCTRAGCAAIVGAPLGGGTLGAVIHALGDQLYHSHSVVHPQWLRQ